MLERLEVQGLGIIDSVVLEPTDGFVVLTGETGAGKSLLVSSLKLLAGARAQADLVRTGDERLRVEGLFTLEAASSPLVSLLRELEIPEADMLVIRREVTAEGRSRAWINDVGVTATTLADIAPHLLAIHGQHEQYGLADSAVQRRLVDEFGAHHAALEKVQLAFAQWRASQDELERLTHAQANRRDRLDVISFQLGEISTCDPHPGEDEELRSRLTVLRHAVRLLELSSSVLDRLSLGENATVDELARAEREVQGMADCGLPLGDAVRSLVDARIQVEEVVRELQGHANNISEDPAELEDVQARLHLLDQLKLKYGGTLADVLSHQDSLEREREELSKVSEHLEQVRAAAATALQEYAAAAAQLEELRHAAGTTLTAAVEEILGRLNMGGTRLELRWFTQPDEHSSLEREGSPVRFTADGVEECQLYISPNPGEELRPMARIASGGELSRIHLALRTALRGRHVTGNHTLLFDEVDTGLGGSTAAALAGLLEELSRHDQVVVVTHLPQVAASAVCHFRIDKLVVDGRTSTRITHLPPAAREEELARMLAGDHVSSSALAHARSLLERR